MNRGGSLLKYVERSVLADCPSLRTVSLSVNADRTWVGETGGDGLSMSAPMKAVALLPGVVVMIAVDSGSPNNIWLGRSGVLPPTTCGSSSPFDLFLASHNAFAFASAPCIRLLVGLQECLWKFSGPGPAKDRPHSLQAREGALSLKDTKSICYEEQQMCYYGDIYSNRGGPECGSATDSAFQSKTRS